MVTEIEVKTFATKSIKLPLTGYIARGLALYMLRTVNPSVSQNLHQPNAVKPYSVTPLYFKKIKIRIPAIINTFFDVKLQSGIIRLLFFFFWCGSLSVSAIMT